jgi:hypothetical protein
MTFLDHLNGIINTKSHSQKRETDVGSWIA